MRLKGEIHLPGDKSIAHRAALFSSLGTQSAVFENYPASADCLATIGCLRDMGVQVKLEENRLQINGVDLFGLREPDRALDAKNSGTTMRLLSGILAAQKFASRLFGDQHLNRRPMGRIIKPLRQMGADLAAVDDQFPPLQFQPVDVLNGIDYELPVASAQVKSCILLAGLHAEGKTSVIEPVPTRDHTERMLHLRKERLNDGRIRIVSDRTVEIGDLSMRIPGDFSSAAFFIIGALLLPESLCVIKNVSLNPTRTGLLDILMRMGAQIEAHGIREFPEPAGDITVSYRKLQGISLEGNIIANIIDEIPILAILATGAEGRFSVRGAAELRVKETDRIRAVCQNLKMLGVEIEEYEDGFSLEGPQRMKGGRVTSFGDHRIAMAFGIAALASEAEIQIDNPDCVNVSFPGFWQMLKQLTN